MTLRPLWLKTWWYLIFCGIFSVLYSGCEQCGERAFSILVKDLFDPPRGVYLHPCAPVVPFCFANSHSDHIGPVTGLCHSHCILGFIKVLQGQNELAVRKGLKFVLFHLFLHAPITETSVFLPLSICNIVCQLAQKIPTGSAARKSL